MTDRERRLSSARLRMRLGLASEEVLVARVRHGEEGAFEALYERHAGELASFCSYMLGCRSDAEDALQATFASAYRALLADQRELALRPWLFAIARNECLTILRRRRPTVELNGERALRGDPARELELREEVRDTLVRLRELPERQRAAMVLAELRGLSQAEIGTVLGVRADQVKALVYQARSDLISERRARETKCDEIREELSSARGAALLRGRLRRHVRSCEDCRTFAAGVARQRRQLSGVLPVAPWLVLKFRAFEEALARAFCEPTAFAGSATLGGTVAGAALQFAGGGIKTIAVKVMAGAAMLGLSTGMGASVAPNQPLARLAGVVSPSHAAGGQHGASSSHARSDSHSRYAGGRGGRSYKAGGAAGTGSGLGGPAHGRVTGGQRSSGEREARAGEAAHSAGAHHASSHAPATKRTSAPSARQQTRARRETRAQQQDSRQVAREERLQRHQETEPQREERRHAAEERRAAAPERRHTAEERRGEAEEHKQAGEQHQRERERGRRQTERAREQEKAKHQRHREAEERSRQREKEKHQRERSRSRSLRQRQRGNGGATAEGEVQA